VAINIPIISTFQKQGIQDAIKQFKALETRAQKFQFIMAKATSPAGLTAMAGAATTAAYAIFNMSKAAAEDQKSQTVLATALRNTTGATDKQIASVEELISSMQMAAGISDTELRTGFQNLVRATKDVTEAQDLLTLATDVSVGTGRSLESVTLALAKAYQGNLSSLKRLGIPLDENIVKTKDFDAATQLLSDTFGGSAANAADTYAGKLAITTQKLQEAAEAIGKVFIPIISDLIDVLDPAVETLNLLGDAMQKNNDETSKSPSVFRTILGLVPVIGKNFRVTADDVGKFADELERVNTVFVQPGGTQLFSGFDKLFKGLEKSTRSYGSALVDIETPLERFLKNLGQIKEEITATFTSLFDLGGAYRDSKNFPDFMKNVKSMVGQIKNYGKNLLKLQGMGLGPLAIQGIMQMDLASGSQFAEDLLAQSNALRDIRTLNQAYTAVGAVAGQVGAGLATGQATGQVTQYITISNPNPQEVVNKLRQYQRVNGAIPIRVTGVA
jgi:hypothetical protein